MSKRIWKGGGVLADGVTVRFAGSGAPSPVPGRGTPHTYGSPASDLKAEQARRAVEAEAEERAGSKRAAGGAQDESAREPEEPDSKPATPPAAGPD